VVRVSPWLVGGLRAEGVTRLFIIGERRITPSVPIRPTGSANRLPHLLLKDPRMSVEANPVLPPGDDTLREHLGYACDLIALSLREITEPPHEDGDREWFRRMNHY
jgi:hypothetical protein